MIKLSIIVPVYNVEEYIEECVQSLLKQTLKDIEIIVVNDGTKDSSIDKIKHLQSDNLIIIHQENAGLSAARNTGLNHAKGEYVTFVDSDDFIIYEEAYEQMYELAKTNHCDIVYGNALKYFSETKNYPLNTVYENDYPNCLSIDEFLVSVLKQKETFAPVWLYLYRRHLLVENNLQFKVGIYHEDEEFTPRVMIRANKVGIYNRVFYFYRQRQGSIVNSKLNVKMGDDVLEACVDLEPLLKTISNDNVRKLYLNYLAALMIEQIYKYKMTNLPKMYKTLILRNSCEKGSKLRSILISVNTQLYLKLEAAFRKNISGPDKFSI